jgi:hypothetical protein
MMSLDSYLRGDGTKNKKSRPKNQKNLIIGTGLISLAVPPMLSDRIFGPLSALIRKLLKPKFDGW